MFDTLCLQFGQTIRKTVTADITQVGKAIHYYENLLENKRTILIGDFNSNTIWDKPRREYNHLIVVKKLKTKNIHSIYHKFFKQAQGKEAHTTLFMYRDKKKQYHIEHCFASADFAEMKVGVNRLSLYL